MMQAQAIMMLAYAGIELVKQWYGYRQDLRKIHPDAGLPPLEPLPTNLHDAAAEYAKAHGLAVPGEGA